MALALDGSVHKNVSSVASTTVSLTTANAGDVIVALVTINSGNVSSITSANTTGWTARKVQISGGINALEEWRGIATAALTSEVITLNFTGTGFTTIDVFGISGGDTSTIYDANAALPDGGTSTGRSITTSNADDFLVGGYRFSSTASPTEGAGWTKISGANFALSEYKIVSATQSSLSVAIGTGNGDQNAGIGDAYIQASGGGTTVALTGVEGTGSAGSLAASVSIALTGNAATGSVGTLTPSTGVVIALTGNEGTGSVGSLAPSVSIALSGNAVTGSVGDLTPVSGVIVALTGNSATGSVGSLAPSISIALTGNQAIGSVGSMSVLGADATVTPGQSFFELAEQSRRWREDDEPEAQPPEVIEAVKQDYERKSAVLVTILDDLEAESNDIRERIAVLEKRKTEKAERELTERKQLLAMAEVKRAIVLEEMEVMDVAYVAAAVLTLQ